MSAIYTSAYLKKQLEEGVTTLTLANTEPNMYKTIVQYNDVIHYTGLEYEVIPSQIYEDFWPIYIKITETIDLCVTDDESEEEETNSDDDTVYYESDDESYIQVDSESSDDDDVLSTIEEDCESCATPCPSLIDSEESISDNDEYEIAFPTSEQIDLYLKSLN